MGIRLCVAFLECEQYVGVPIFVQGHVCVCVNNCWCTLNAFMGAHIHYYSNLTLIWL